MSKKFDKVIEIYEKYQLDYNRELLDEDDIHDLGSVLLPLENNEICCVETGEPPGTWISGELHKEFSEIVENVVKLSNGKVKLENFVAQNEHDDEEADGTITISFDHNDEHYLWSFELDEYFEYYEDVMEWAASALGEGFYVQEHDTMIAWYVNPHAFKELQNIFNE